MSEGHPAASAVICSASTSGSSREDGEGAVRSATECTANTIPRFCVNEIPWKLVPQMFEESGEYDFLDENDLRLSDVESFVWKWSPCGRYGIDMPGGRDVINQQLKDRVAVFDLHTNTWTFYVMNVVPSEIPRVCFLYWIRNDLVAIVSLVKDAEAGPDDEVVLKFRQSFYFVSHEAKTLDHAGQCKYRTEKTIVASYWYHIFENRRGEPFIDHNKDVWVVFSNGKDSLILIPFLPTPTCWEAKCVDFDMNEIMGSFIGKRVFLDPFISSHFVPWVYRNDINFFIRIDAYSFCEDRDYGQDEEIADATTKEKCGMYQIRINLKDVIEKREKAAGPVEDTSTIKTVFERTDVELYRKISEDSWHAHECISQHGKTVVLLRWEPYSIHMSLSKKLNTRVCDSITRGLECCAHGKRDFSFCTIDLDTEKIRKFDSLILGTDVIIPHPNGSMLMFRYKEDYGMRFCELPYFEPPTLQMKCMQALSGCVEIDPAYYYTTCCLKEPPKEEDDPRSTGREHTEFSEI